MCELMPRRQIQPEDEILRALKEVHPASLTWDELRTRAGISKGSMSNHLGCMISQGLVSKTDQGYSLGEGHPCLLDENYPATCYEHTPKKCVDCQVAKEIKILRRAVEIRAPWDPEGHPIARQISAEELEGRPLQIERKVVGHYRNVRKLNIFVADFELTGPAPEGWIHRIASSNPIKVWMRDIFLKA